MGEAIGWIGQSNAAGFANWLSLSTPASGSELAHLLFWQIDLQQFSDDVGQWTAMSFDPSLQDVPTSAFDYPPNLGFPTWFSFLVPYSFGPEIYGGLAIRDYLSADVLNVKLAMGGSFLKGRPPGPPTVYGGPWTWLQSHASWDTTQDRDTSPYDATVVASGTATGVTSAFPLLSSLTDSGASWTPGEFKDCWVWMDGMQGLILDNTATQLTVQAWVWDLLTGPSAGAYTIERRTYVAASLTKHFLATAAAAFGEAGGTLADFDMGVVVNVIGESDSTDLALSLNAKQNMLSVIWAIRQGLVAEGITSRDDYGVGFVITLVKEGTVWPFAENVNALFRELAECDPNVRLVPVQDLPLGGYTGTDQLHYNHDGQRTLGQRCGAAAIELLSPSLAATRKSHRYYRQHVVVSPVWGVGTPVHQMLVASQIAGVPNLRYPGWYAERDGMQGLIPVYLDQSGGNILQRPFGGAAPGFAHQTVQVGQEPVDAFQARPAAVTRARGSLTRAQTTGFVWPAGAGSYDPWSGRSLTVTSATQTHVLQVGPVVNRMRTTVAGTGIDREWVARAHSGARGISGTLRIDERAGDDVGAYWMEHRIGHGDYHQAQVTEGFTKVAPLISMRVDTETDCALVGQEFNCDSGVPSLRDGVQTGHGGTAALGDSVLWPNVTVRQRVTPNFRGIEGAFRIVYEWTPTFQVGGGMDTTALEIACYGTVDFDQQFVYDPATDTLTDLSWSGSDNRYSEATTGALTRYNSNGTVYSTAGAPFSLRYGLVGWRADGGVDSSGDDLTYGFFQRLSSDSRGGGYATHLRVGERTSASPVAGFADYDQPSWCYVQQRVENAASVVYAAGQPIRAAAFLCVGTLAQVKAAAAALAALQVNSTWTD